jgi:hypothetical protein
MHMYLCVCARACARVRACARHLVDARRLVLEGEIGRRRDASLDHREGLRGRSGIVNIKINTLILIIKIIIIIVNIDIGNWRVITLQLCMRGILTLQSPNAKGKREDRKAARFKLKTNEKSSPDRGEAYAPWRSRDA